MVVHTNDRKNNIRKKLLIGLDPEFLLYDKAGKFVTAKTGLAKLGCGYTSEIGVDHDNETCELRPKAGTPAQVVKTMTKLLRRLDKGIKKDGLSVYAGASSNKQYRTIPLGGHIHFNIPSNTVFTEILDAFIGKPMKKMEGSTRRSYGGLSDTESKRHGFEYRTPPSFIGKPDLFAGVISLAYCLAKTWVKYKKKNGNVWSYDDIPSAENYRALVGYKTYAKHIDMFLSYVNEGKSIVENDVLAAWEITSSLEDVSL